MELRIPMSSFGENQRFRATSERQDRSSDYPDTAALTPSKGTMPEMVRVVKLIAVSVVAKMMGSRVSIHHNYTKPKKHLG